METHLRRLRDNTMRELEDLIDLMSMEIENLETIAKDYESEIEKLKSEIDTLKDYINNQPQ